MPMWIAYLYYKNGKTQEFTLYAKDYAEAQDRVTAIFPNISFSIRLS